MSDFFIKLNPWSQQNSTALSLQVPGAAAMSSTTALSELDDISYHDIATPTTHSPIKAQPMQEPPPMPITCNRRRIRKDVHCSLERIFAYKIRINFRDAPINAIANRDEARFTTRRGIPKLFIHSTSDQPDRSTRDSVSPTKAHGRKTPKPRRSLKPNG